MITSTRPEQRHERTTVVVHLYHISRGVKDELKTTVYTYKGLRLTRSTVLQNPISCSLTVGMVFRATTPPAEPSYPQNIDPLTTETMMIMNQQLMTQLIQVSTTALWGL